MPAEFTQVPLSSLAVGTVLSSPLFDCGSDRQLLLAKGIVIDEHLFQKLVQRGITQVSISKRDHAALTSGKPQGIRSKAEDHQYSAVSLQTAGSDSVEADMQSGEFRTEIESETERPLLQKTDRYDKDAIEGEIQQREECVTYVENLFGKLIQGDGTDTAVLTDLCRKSIQAVISDKDLFLCLGINPYNSEYPSRHSMHVSSVAISIGVVLGLDDQSLIDLGTGCLIHDVGMLKLDQGLYRCKRKLKARDLGALSEHPILTMDALACPGVQLSRIARIVAYQIHERCNGSGYPRGAKAEELHSLSKIAAVADAYVGLVSQRWHREALMPYHAIKKLLDSIPTGLYDPKAVRGLLNAVSLFPLGSFVETNDGQIARVVRSTGETYMQPIIELWNEKHRQFEPDLVNLTQDPSIQIKRAIARLPQER